MINGIIILICLYVKYVYIVVYLCCNISGMNYPLVGWKTTCYGWKLVRFWLPWVELWQGHVGRVSEATTKGHPLNSAIFKTSSDYEPHHGCEMTMTTMTCSSVKVWPQVTPLSCCCWYINWYILKCRRNDLHQKHSQHSKRLLPRYHCRETLSALKSKAKIFVVW